MNYSINEVYEIFKEKFPQIESTYYELNKKVITEKHLEKMMIQKD